MKIFIILALSLSLGLLSGCSSTQNIQTMAMKQKTSKKKPLISDHYLMMTLLDRPIPEDQKIMLAFANYQDNYQQTYNQTPDLLVHPIMIKGEYHPQESKKNTHNIYQNLIIKDNNAIRLNGPL